MTVISTVSPVKKTPQKCTLSPTKQSPTFKAGFQRKRKLSTLRNTGCSSEKRRRQAESYFEHIQLQRATKPVGEPWPIHDLRAFDAPTEPQLECNNGPMLRDVLKSRGWRCSTNPCHGVVNEMSGSTFWIQEFEASLLGEDPRKVFGKDGVVVDGYRLQALPLPKHALWMMGRLPYRIPGTGDKRHLEREDFVKLVIKHGDKLTGKLGNYRIAKFPGTEPLCWKTKLTEAFQDKPWYPATYILPKDKGALLKNIESRGQSRDNLWIGKPRNECAGAGICVWKGTDPELIKVIKESDKKPASLVQSYLLDPLLVGGYKFHMRIHLIITNLNPLEAYVQENGQCLFATKPYTLASKTLGNTFDPPVHVTNLGLNTQPNNKDNFFAKKPIVGRGQQIRMHQLVSHLSEHYPGFNKRALWQQILSISADTTRYFAQGIQRYHKVVPDRHFEIFGLDLMLDKDFKVWMCEVNTDPGLSYPDKEVLGSPNPDYQKELKACEETWHDQFSLLGLDAGREQTQGSLRHWFKVDFSDGKGQS